MKGQIVKISSDLHFVNYNDNVYPCKCRGLFRKEEREIEKDIKHEFPQCNVQVCLIPVTIGECKRLWYENL